MAVVVLAFGTAAQADVITHGGTTIDMDFVTIGNAGNAADDTGYGSVDYNYRIDKYEVTAAQWAVVIAADSNVGNAGYWSGSQPTAGTSWYAAAKFCNWLTTGNANSGVYNTSTWAIMNRQTALANFGTAYFIPTEDEWYKAAYHKNDGVTENYFDYPTSSDLINTSMANYGNSVGHPTRAGTSGSGTRRPSVRRVVRGAVIGPTVPTTCWPPSASTTPTRRSRTPTIVFAWQVFLSPVA